MNLNNLMHSRNRYKDNPPDFKELAEKYAYFQANSRQNTHGNVTVDFKNPQCLRALLYAVLENDFNIKIEIPLDRLIPTLPSRLNYIHWIEDLVKCLGEVDAVTGVDIGTGASCIYPILGTKLNGWKFLATEVDECSARYAQDNVKKNNFSENIKVHLVGIDDYLIKPLQDTNIKNATFCMCNPPFFSSEDEAILGAARTDKRPIPISVSTGSTNETITTGGEVEFVKGIISDSLELQQAISWYSSLMGKKSSLKAIIAYLKEKKVPTVVTTQFCQGKTMRWGVAWTFIPGITTSDIASPPLKKRKKEAKPLTFTIPSHCPMLSIGKDHSIFEAAVKLMDSILNDLKVDINERHLGNKVCQWQCSASEITWSNQRQKRRKQQLKDINGSTYTERTEKSTTEPIPCKSNTEEKTEANDTNMKQDTVIEVNSKDIQSYCEDNKTEESGNRNIGKNCKGGGDLIDVKDINSPLCMFQVKIDDNSEDGIHVQVKCIQADDKNQVYQFYQFLNNKIVRGL